MRRILVLAGFTAAAVTVICCVDGGQEAEVPPDPIATKAPGGEPKPVEFNDPPAWVDELVQVPSAPGQRDLLSIALDRPVIVNGTPVQGGWPEVRRLLDGQKTATAEITVQRPGPDGKYRTVRVSVRREVTTHAVFSRVRPRGVYRYVIVKEEEIDPDLN